MGMKPIFEQERKFFKEKTGINLPTDCWRNGQKIYLDIYCSKPLYQFKVENKEIKITKNNTELFKEYQQIKLNETIKKEEDKLNKLYKQSYEFLYNYLLEHKDIPIVFNHSGGKDSCLSYEIFKDVLKNILDLDYVISFANTSNDTPDTYKFIKNELPKDKLKIMNPKEGFYQWIKRKNYFIPTVLTRNCCATYKEEQIQKNYDKNKEYIMILGVRKYESTKRAKYDWIMDYNFYSKLFKNNNQPKKWINIAPIIEWEDKDVWLYILKNNIKINKQYYYGYNRCGCLICPYQHDYIDLLTEKYYPNLWKRWIDDILYNNYINNNIKKSMKWSFQEYINGKWKTGVSKTYEIINKKPTKENINELMEVLQIKDYNLALKYFDKKCSNCNKKMNPNEIAMNLKLFGRQVNMEKCLCKKCLCEKMNIKGKDYNKMVYNFREQGCNLF